MDDTTIAGLIRRQGRERAASLAFITPTRRWTYGEIDAESNRAAQGLAQLGVGVGDRISCLTKHAAEFTVMALAAAKLGAVALPVNWRLAAPEVEFIVNNGEAKFLMADEAFLPSVIANARLPKLMKIIATQNAAGVEGLSQWCAQFEAIDPGHVAAPDDTCVQLYSSGTTGLPKGVEITNKGILATLAVYSETIGFNGDSVMLHALPAFHVAGVTTSLMPLAQGGKIVFLPEFDPAVAIATIAEQRISHTFLVPAMILFMLQSPRSAAADYSSLKIIAYGGSPISDTVIAEAKRTFQCGLVQIYGMTEASLLTRLMPEDHDPGGPRAHLSRSAGRPALGVEIRIVNSFTGETVPDGLSGEIWARTAQSLKGYWRNEAATRDIYPLGRGAEGGWFRTGDAAYLREGYVYINDRIKDMIISGGENVYPAEVENVLAEHPAISECAVIGVPDAKWGESVMACVVLKNGASATEQDIIDFTRSRLAHFKCPKAVAFSASLPRNPSGKLLKRILREPYWKNRDRSVS